jgi:molecular chaperone GrpE (heat shock protein)
LEGPPALPVDEAQLSSNREFAQGSHQELRQLNEQLQMLQRKQQDSDVKIDGLVRTAQRAYEATHSLSQTTSILTSKLAQLDNIDKRLETVETWIRRPWWRRLFGD